MSQNTGNDHSNPLSRVFSKIFHHDDAHPPAAQPPVQAPATPTPAQPRTAAPAATPQPAATVTPAVAPPQPATTAAPKPTAATPVVTPTSTQRTHTVEAGDSLSKIAQHVYGRADRWSLIHEANRDRISDPDRIFPGQVLVLPNAPSVQ